MGEFWLADLMFWQSNTAMRRWQLLMFMGILGINAATIQAEEHESPWAISLSSGQGVTDRRLRPSSNFESFLLGTEMSPTYFKLSPAEQRAFFDAYMLLPNPAQGRLTGRESSLMLERRRRYIGLLLGFSQNLYSVEEKVDFSAYSRLYALAQLDPKLVPISSARILDIAYQKRFASGTFFDYPSGLLSFDIGFSAHMYHRSFFDPFFSLTAGAGTTTDGFAKSANKLSLSLGFEINLPGNFLTFQVRDTLLLGSNINEGLFLLGYGLRFED